MTVPVAVAWPVARAIAAGDENEEVELYGPDGSAQVFADGQAYVRIKKASPFTIKSTETHNLVRRGDGKKEGADPEPKGIEL